MKTGTLKIVCDSVVSSLYRNVTSIEYVREPLESDEGDVSQRIMKAEMLALEDTVVTIPVAKCIYKHATFYLTRASSDTAFVLRRDVHLFRLSSGLHDIRFTT